MEKTTLIPPVDVFETGDKYILVLDMPGTTKEGIEVTAENDTLTIKGSVQELSEEWTPLSTEFRLGDYKRDFTIGSKIDHEKIDAKYDNGVLTIELTKSEHAKPRRIDVKLN
ncbi:MAG: Hsp20/alpha crystallin family protein [Brevinematales bacterium]|nr:Hsp20/alpha crystallin family protein [Brevinematales bacterium]